MLKTVKNKLKENLEIITVSSFIIGSYFFNIGFETLGFLIFFSAFILMITNAITDAKKSKLNKYSKYFFRLIVAVYLISLFYTVITFYKEIEFIVMLEESKQLIMFAIVLFIVIFLYQKIKTTYKGEQ